MKREKEKEKHLIINPFFYLQFKNFFTVPVGKIAKKQSEGVRFFVNSYSAILSKIHSYRLLSGH